MIFVLSSSIRWCVLNTNLVLIGHWLAKRKVFQGTAESFALLNSFLCLFTRVRGWVIGDLLRITGRASERGRESWTFTYRALATLLLGICRAFTTIHLVLVALHGRWTFCKWVPGGT